MALTYTQLATQGADAGFISRVQEALLQDVNANRLQATPASLTDNSLPALRDRLGRAILERLSYWAPKFAQLVALQLIAKTNLLDPAVTLDADLFSAVSAVYDKFLPNT